MWRECVSVPVCTYPIKVPYCRSTTSHAVWGNLGEIHVSCIPLRCKLVDVWSKHHIAALDSDAVTYWKGRTNKTDVRNVNITWIYIIHQQLHIRLAIAYFIRIAYSIRNKMHNSNWNVWNLRHHFGLLDKIIFGHSSTFHHFNGSVDRTAPFATSYNTKLTRAKLFEQHQFGWVNFPFVMWQTGGWWYWSITGRWLQSAGQSTGIVTMIIYQIGNGFATVLFWQVILISAILFNVIVFDMWLRAANWKHKHRH